MGKAWAKPLTSQMSSVFNFKTFAEHLLAPR